MTHSGQLIETLDELISELALRSMLRYEQQPTPRVLVVAEAGESLEEPERTRHFYRRLIDESGGPARYFITWVSETLVLWMEESFEGAFFTSGGRPGDADPAYDLLAIIHDDSAVPRLRLVQVKATENRLQENCGLALRKFERLERGDYNAELLAKLKLLEDLGKLPNGVQARDLLYDGDRRYRVAAVHGEDRTGVTIMTTFHEKVLGGSHRRSARFVHISDWPSFWAGVSEVVYAQLT